MPHYEKHRYNAINDNCHIRFNLINVYDVASSPTLHLNTTSSYLTWVDKHVIHDLLQTYFHI